ncbi:MAG: hypothetical protein NVV70_16960 [Cellulomonas sp.]|nr:hypothetical protein [Cellulomonas sp.]MCR6649737.1 hypothetical protein [Cellulomonas sp.]
MSTTNEGARLIAAHEAIWREHHEPSGIRLVESRHDWARLLCEDPEMVDALSWGDLAGSTSDAERHAFAAWLGLHTVTVAVSDDSDDVDIEIIHPEDGSCPRVWWECVDCPEPPPEGEDPYEWYDEPRHGKQHQSIDGWCTEGTECYLSAIHDAKGLDDIPDESGVYVLDYEGGALEDSYLILGAKLGGVR